MQMMTIRTARVSPVYAYGYVECACMCNVYAHLAPRLELAWRVGSRGSVGGGDRITHHQIAENRYLSWGRVWGRVWVSIRLLRVVGVAAARSGLGLGFW